MRHVQNVVPYYEFKQWQSAPLKHGIFTRHGGVSPTPWDGLNVGGTVGDDIANVRRNHELMFEALELDETNACSVWQVHGADTVIVTTPPKQRKWINRADGMVTNQPNMPLVMRYADCVPIMFFDPIQQAIGIAHAGWRGTVSGAQVSVLNTMQDAYGSNPEDVQVGIGPSIGPDHYEVKEDVLLAVETELGTTDGYINYASDGCTYFDLWSANEKILTAAGVLPEHIETARICTASTTDEFYSHRAEKGKTGRFGAIISL